MPPNPTKKLWPRTPDEFLALENLTVRLLLGRDTIDLDVALKATGSGLHLLNMTIIEWASSASKAPRKNKALVTADVHPYFMQLFDKAYRLLNRNGGKNVIDLRRDCLTSLGLTEDMIQQESPEPVCHHHLRSLQLFDSTHRKSVGSSSANGEVERMLKRPGLNSMRPLRPSTPESLQSGLPESSKRKLGEEFDEGHDRWEKKPKFAGRTRAPRKEAPPAPPPAGSYPQHGQRRNVVQPTGFLQSQLSESAHPPSTATGQASTSSLHTRRYNGVLADNPSLPPIVPTFSVSASNAGGPTPFSAGLYSGHSHNVYPQYLYPPEVPDLFAPRPSYSRNWGNTQQNAQDAATMNMPAHGLYFELGSLATRQATPSDYSFAGVHDATAETTGWDHERNQSELELDDDAASSYVKSESTGLLGNPTLLEASTTDGRHFASLFGVDGPHTNSVNHVQPDTNVTEELLTLCNFASSSTHSRGGSRQLSDRDMSLIFSSVAGECPSREQPDETHSDTPGPHPSALDAI